MADIIEFHRVSLEDREKVAEFRKVNPYCNCDYSFGNLYNWGFYYNTEIAFHKEMMIIRFNYDKGSRTAYLMPIGEGDFAEVMKDMEHTQLMMDKSPLVLMSVIDSGLELLRNTFPENLHIIENRDYSDYIYCREKMATLSGKKLQSKRNHINKFKRLYPDYIYEELTKENAKECIIVEEKWYDQSKRTDDIKEERRMVCTALEQFEEIGLTGGCLRVNGQVIAFTLGMPISEHCFGVNIEKADTDFEGAYAVINNEFAKRIPEKFTCINREEDLGVEGLRKAKLSYYPEQLMAKHTVLIRYQEEQ